MRSINFPIVQVALLLLVNFTFVNSVAQVGIGTTNPDANAKLDIVSTTTEPGGLLLPRVSLTATNNSSPLTGTVTAGMAVYNTATSGVSPNNVTPGYYYHDGTQWIRLAAATASGSNEDWSLTGNSGTAPGTGTNENFIGTKDNQSLIIATYNTQRIRILGNGQMIVNANNPLSRDRFTVQGNVDEYAISGVTSGANAAAIYGQNTTADGFGVFGNASAGSGILGMSTLGGFGVEGLNNGTGKGVMGFSFNSGIGVQGQNNGNGAGVFGANTGAGPGIQALNNGIGNALEVFQDGSGNGIYNEVAQGRGIYNRILGSGHAGIITDLQANGGIGELVGFGNKNGIGFKVSAVENPSNPGAGNAGDVWGMITEIKTNSPTTNNSVYGGVLAADQYGKGQGILMNHRGVSGRNVDFNSLNASNEDANITAISLNRASTIVAQNQNNSIHSAIRVADIGYMGTDGVDHIGVFGYSSPVPTYGIGVQGKGGFYGVHGIKDRSGAGWGVFSTGDIGGTGTKHFVIDDPRDPENKYLRHASIESNEILNLYRGTATFGVNGSVLVKLPDYYEVINKNPSYQLTAIGASMPDLYIQKEVSEGSFVISGGVSGKKVSWILTAERNDPYLQQNPEVREVVLDKGPRRGKYLTPELYGQPKEMAISYYEPKMATINQKEKIDSPQIEEENVKLRPFSLENGSSMNEESEKRQKTVISNESEDTKVIDTPEP